MRSYTPHAAGAHSFWPIIGLVAGLLAAGCSEPKKSDLPSGENGGARRDVEFTEVTAEAGLGEFEHRTGAFGEKWFPETMGSGGGFIDYDGDGWQDIILVGGGEWPDRPTGTLRALWLYRNNRDGTFTLASREAGLEDVDTYGFGVTVADYDNDGDQDFFLTTLYENLLFRNDGGRFAEVGREAGVSDVSAWSSAAVFLDADRDGHLDLYVGNYVKWSPETDIWCTTNGTDKNYCTPRLYEGLSARFYHNNGDGTFTERSAETGVSDLPGKTLGAVALDYNDDGWIDLAVANDQMRDLLLVNNGDGTFAEKGLSSGLAFDENGIARSGMGIDAGIVDTTGEVTVFVGNFSHEMMGVYRHNGSGAFIDRAAQSGIGRPTLLTLTFGLFLFDADLDGDLDVFAANGEVREGIEEFVDGISHAQRAQLFVNDGYGHFAEARSQEGPLAQTMVARGAAYADYDRDGDLDVLVTENGREAHLWRNDAEGTSVRVHLAGAESNRSGIGAQLVALAGGRRMERRLSAGSSFLSQPELVVTFGLADGQQLDSLAVHWPSGRSDRLGPLSGGSEVLVEEGSGVKPMNVTHASTARP